MASTGYRFALPWCSPVKIRSSYWEKYECVNCPGLANVQSGQLPVRTSARGSKEIRESITTSDLYETSIGTLKFLDGALYPETAGRVYDQGEWVWLNTVSITRFSLALFR